MAEDLKHSQATQSALTAAAPATVERGRRTEDRRVYRLRFAIVYLLLAVAAGVGVGAAIVLQDRAPEDAGVAWSEWRPEGRQSSYPRQIGAYIGARYKLENGKPLVGVLATKAEVPAGDGTSVLPIRGAVIFNNPNVDEEDRTFVETEDSVLYTLCGFGQGCAITEGEPSEARLQYLRREALELALYSFKYVDGLDTVITLMPTNLGDEADPQDDTSVAAFFRRSDLDAILDRPLARSFSPTPPAMGRIPEAEALSIERLTRIFRYEFTPTQTNSLVMLLLPAQ